MDSDGDEIQFGILPSDRQSSYNERHYPQQSQQIEQYFNRDQNYNFKKQSPTGIISQKPYQIDEQKSFAEKSQSKIKQGLFKILPERKKKFIQIQRKVKQKYIICKKGNKRETSLLNINLKTFISSLLREFLLFNEFNKYEQDKINSFFSSKANFTSFQKLYGVQDQQHQENSEGIKKKVIVKEKNDNLRRFLLQKFEKGDFIEKIMTNKKMSYQNKISMIKFCAQIRKSCIHPQIFNNWKMMSTY